MTRLRLETQRFVGIHRIHILLLLPGAVLWTVFHELAHAVAVHVQRGQVTEFVWLPSPARWGHVRYAFPVGRAHSPLTLTLAPYAVARLLCLCARLLARRAEPFSRRAAAAVLI